jgi:hypothetical protein
LVTVAGIYRIQRRVLWEEVLGYKIIGVAPIVLERVVAARVVLAIGEVRVTLHVLEITGR